MQTPGPTDPPPPPIPAAPGLRERLRAVPRQLLARIHALKDEHASPGRLGLAVAVGVLIGASPFLGLQLVLAVALATLFGLNRFAVLLGSQVSVPPLTPLVLFANAQVGAFLLTGRWLPLSLQALREVPAKQLVAELFADLLVGGLVVGGALALILGGATAHFVSLVRAPDELAPHLSTPRWKELQRRLGALPRAWRSYARWKLRLDPVYGLVLTELPEDVDLVDLGSGMGLLPLLLALRSPRARVRALEWDARKARVARELLADLPGMQVVEGDARAGALGQPQAITLVDVLHYSPVEEQRQWLERCAHALAPGGLLLIRELEPARSRRTWATRLEKLAVRWGWNQGATVQAWAPSEMAHALTALGFTAVIHPAGSGAFRANSLVVARKPSAS
ncbi:DUF2062 domain-containing protein [Myxococcaceae bacterium JPH2]|nr:DUF2062 domain-containing protein [Myxococcaceae bacterium JPH2]